MGFCQLAEMGPKVGQKWVFGRKSGLKRVKTHVCTHLKPISGYPRLHPLKTHFGIFTKTHFWPNLRGVEIVF